MDNSREIHATAEVQSSLVGNGTKIGQFALILSRATIGDRCKIGVGVHVGNDVVIGNDVVVQNGVQIGGNVLIASDVRIETNVVFLENSARRSEPYISAMTHIHTGASIGGNSTIYPGIVIGRGAIVTAGSVVTRDVPSHAIVSGNPATIAGYERSCEEQPPAAVSLKDNPPLISGLSQVNFATASDLRGDLMAVEFTKHVAFPVKRAFFVTNVPSHHVRGEHGHKVCHQLLVCLQGSLMVSADNGSERGQWLLDDAGVGLHVHPMVWAAQYHSSNDAVLAVFASHAYDADDYIRDYETFLELVKGERTQS